MRAQADLIRTAGNVLLIPVTLSKALAHVRSGRALVAGAGDEAAVARATTALRQAALRQAAPEARPQLSVEVLGEPGLESPGLWSIRRRRYDVSCLLLTGEGRTREKLLALLAGAPITLAMGADGRWYRVSAPPLHPWSLRWWARLSLAGTLCAAYLWAALMIRLVDGLRSLAPPGAPAPDPGPAAGKQTTLIVPTYNQRHLMDFCLPPLLAEAGGEHRVMIVDDASTDGTSEYVRSKYPAVRVLRLAKNRGFAGAVRAGIAATETPLFALINTDVQVRPGFLGAILPRFDQAATFAVCSRIDLPGGSQMETGNVATTFSGILEPYHVPPTRPGPILYAGGASSVFHRARYHALGGFETVYRPLYWEDIELGYRAWRRGWRVLFEPRASVLHQRRAWMGPRFGEAYSNETFLKNALLFVWKNVRDRGLLDRHLVYVCARLGSELLAGERTMCRAVLRALPLLPWLLLKRWGERRRGDVGDREILARARPPAAGAFEEVRPA